MIPVRSHVVEINWWSLIPLLPAHPGSLLPGVSFLRHKPLCQAVLIDHSNHPPQKAPTTIDTGQLRLMMLTGACINRGVYTGLLREAADMIEE